MDPVRRQYETYPYLARDPAEARARSRFVPNLVSPVRRTSGIAACIAAILLVGGSCERAVAGAGLEIVEGVVSEVTEDGAFRFFDQEDQLFRAWGIRPNVEDLRKRILGNVMKCVIIRARVREGDPIPLGCTAEIHGQKRNLRNDMLLEGMAVEDCEDTRGGYTKMLRQLARDEPNMISDKLLIDPDCPVPGKQ